MKSLLRTILIAGGIGLAFYFMIKSKADKLSALGKPQKNPMTVVRANSEEKHYETNTPRNTEKVEEPELVVKPQQLSEKNESLFFRIEDGIAIVDGDIVLGIPLDHRSGTAGAPADIPLWPGGKLPFVIPSELRAPDRILKAMEYFSSTPIQFVPYQGEEDYLIFVPTEKDCKSYVGKVGGQQPIWVGPQCSPEGIAHEIMHALGFIHEQNRSDRNRYIRVIENNILDHFKINFEVFPRSMMKVSGITPFDFQSIMLYPPTAFSKSGAVTMEPLSPGEVIAPSSQLSEKDKLRLRAVYGN